MTGPKSAGAFIYIIWIGKALEPEEKLILLGTGMSEISSLASCPGNLVQNKGKVMDE